MKLLNKISEKLHHDNILETSEVILLSKIRMIYHYLVFNSF